MHNFLQVRTERLPIDKLVFPYNLSPESLSASEKEMQVLSDGRTLCKNGQKEFYIEADSLRHSAVTASKPTSAHALPPSFPILHCGSADCDCD